MVVPTRDCQQFTLQLLHGSAVVTDSQPKWTASKEHSGRFLPISHTGTSDVPSRSIVPLPTPAISDTAMERWALLERERIPPFLLPIRKSVPSRKCHHVPFLPTSLNISSKLLSQLRFLKSKPRATIAPFGRISSDTDPPVSNSSPRSLPQR